MKVYPVQKGSPLKNTKLFSDSYEQVGYARALIKDNMSKEQLIYLVDESVSYLEQVLDHFLISNETLNTTKRRGI